MTVPDEALIALKMDLDHLRAEMQIAAAMKLYEMGRISSGAAARLAGIPKPVFLSKLHEYQIPSFRLTKEELLEDWNNARGHN